MDCSVPVVADFAVQVEVMRDPGVGEEAVRRAATLEEAVNVSSALVNTVGVPVAFADVIGEVVGEDVVVVAEAEETVGIEAAVMAEEELAAWLADYRWVDLARRQTHSVVGEVSDEDVALALDLNWSGGSCSVTAGGISYGEAAVYRVEVGTYRWASEGKPKP